MASYKCVVDGACRGSGTKGKRTGQGAAAVLIYKDNKLIGEYSRPLGEVTSNAAEFEAVILAATLCWSTGLPTPTIYTDSSVVYNAFHGIKEPDTPELNPLIYTLNQIKNNHPFKLVQVKRREVSEADFLAKQCLDDLQRSVRNKRLTRDGLDVN